MSGMIGEMLERYYSQDEIGTPFCITVDFDSLEDGARTVRIGYDETERIQISNLKALNQKLNF